MPLPSFRPFCANLFAAGLLLSASCARSGLEVPDLLHECVAIAPDGPTARLVSAEVLLDRSDILLLVDNSNSMYDEIERIRMQLVDVLVPQIAERIGDAQLGVAAFSDFGEREVGQRSHPYQLLQPITPDIGRVLRAVENIELEYGGDAPESQLEALYQVATGEGLGVYAEPGPACADDRRGGACFRAGSFAIAVLFTDAPMRNVVGIDPTGRLSPGETVSSVNTEAPFIPYLRGYRETLQALRAESIRVVGLWSGMSDESDGIDDLRRVARDTGTVDEAGGPIVLAIGSEGEGLGEGVVQSLELATRGARLDVALELSDADLDDGVDPRALVTSVRAARAEPADGAVRDGEGFVGVRSGTRVYFEVVFDPSRAPQLARAQRYPLGLRIAASDGTLLSDEIVDLVVAGDACRFAADSGTP